MRKTRNCPSVPGSDRVLRSHTVQHVHSSSKPSKSKERRSRTDPRAPKRKRNLNSRPQPSPPSHMKCRICIEEQALEEFVKWVPPFQDLELAAMEVPPGCMGHLTRDPKEKGNDPVCKTCIGNFISAKLDMLGVHRLSRGCLQPGCNITWQPQFLVRYLDGEALEKYNIAMFEAWKTEVRPQLVTCVSPTCNAIGLPDVYAPGFPQVSCHACATRYCAQCGVSWHQGLSCAEYSATAVNENMTEQENQILALIQSIDGRRCPNCQLVIIKDGGCHNMLCSACRTYFHWDTAASAVIGPRKAEPWFRDVAAYWTPAHHPSKICEQDAIDQELLGAGAHVSK